jgi:hypothetical protein
MRHASESSGAGRNLILAIEECQVVRPPCEHIQTTWSDQIEARVKAEVAELVEANPATALNVHKRSSFDALVSALETKLNTIADSKA